MCFASRAVRVLSVVFMVGAVVPACAVSARLRPETVDTWNAYVKATEERIESELESGWGFLIQDFDSQSEQAREQVLSGELVMAPMETIDDEGNGIPIPNGRIHHWRGSVFIPGVNLEQYLYRAQNPLEDGSHHPDVLEYRVLEKKPDELKIYIKMIRQKFVTVAYSTEHHLTFQRHGEGRASSRSEATKIAELVDVGKMMEREKPVGEDRGFMWRLNSYWRYEEVDGGLIVEGETLLLSRDIPGILEPFIKPLIIRSAQEMLGNTLEEIKENQTTREIAQVQEIDRTSARNP